jgi:hypothetical protein
MAIMKKKLASVRQLAARPIALSASAGAIVARSRDVSTDQLAHVAGGWRYLGNTAA